MLNSPRSQPEYYSGELSLVLPPLIYYKYLEWSHDWVRAYQHLLERSFLSSFIQVMLLVDLNTGNGVI